MAWSKVEPKVSRAWHRWTWDSASLICRQADEVRDLFVRLCQATPCPGHGIMRGLRLRGAVLMQDGSHSPLAEERYMGPQISETVVD